MVIVISLVVVFIGCQPKPKPPVDFNAQLPPGAKALRKIPMDRWPDFSVQMTDRGSLLAAIDNSLKYLAAPSSQQYFPYDDITHERAVATLRAMKQIASQPSVNWQAEMQQKFEVYQSVGAPDPEGGFTNKVLFTGYHTPTYEASKLRGGKFQWPIYKRPAGAPPVGDPSPVTKLTRAQIDTDPSPLAGNELCYVPSRWQAYVIQVQGSARLRMQSGQIMEIGYAGSNGYDYVPIALKMRDDGVITPAQLSLRGISNYFTAHPDAMDKYLNMNPRYVFFTERPGGPFGSLNVPVTALATIATDKSVYPRAMPAFPVVQIPLAGGAESAPHRGFMLDQDTGGAIRAAGRCDIYMGRGFEAEARAGNEMHEGQLYYVALRPELVTQYMEAGRP